MPKTGAKPEEAGKETATPQQSEAAGHEGRHADREGSHAEGMDEGSH